MITPLDIEKKEFSKGMRGYSPEEVDSYLNQIIIEMDRLIKENNALKDENEKMRAEITATKSSEEEVISTLETARKLMSEISASAEKRAELLLKNARLEADIIKREAKEASEKFMEESKSIRTRVTSLRERYKNMLEDELDRFDTLSKDIFEEADDIIANLPEVQTRDTIETAPVKNVPEADEDMSKTMLNIR